MMSTGASEDTTIDDINDDYNSSTAHKHFHYTIAS